MDLKTFTDDPKNNPDGQKFRNVSERRKFVREKLGLKLVRDPRTGAECVPVHDKTLMLTGLKKTITRERQETHDDRASAKESFAKQRDDYKVQTNKVVPWLNLIVIVSVYSFVWNTRKKSMAWSGTKGSVGSYSRVGSVTTMNTLPAAYFRYWGRHPESCSCCWWKWRVKFVKQWCFLRFELCLWHSIWWRGGSRQKEKAPRGCPIPMSKAPKGRGPGGPGARGEATASSTTKSAGQGQRREWWQGCESICSRS